MTPMTHEQCSELLAPYIEGDLAAPESAEVGAHLSGCDPCRHEEAGLRALMAGATGALNERERAQLRAGVMTAISKPEEVPSLYKLQRPAPAVFVPPRTNWKARAAGAMAAAAGVILVAGLFYLGSGGLSGDDAATQKTGGGDIGRNQAPEGLERELGGLEDNAGGGGGSAVTTEGFAAPVPAFIRVERRYDDARLTRLGERGLQLVLFRRAYTADDAPRLQQDFVDRLAASAARRAGEAAADQVRACAAVVLAREETVLPAFGALGRLEDHDVLVLGFAWSEEPSGPMDRYMLWTWPRGSCDSPLDYRSGSIKPAN